MTKLLMALGLVVSIPAFAEDQVQISDKIMLGANNTPATGSLSISVPSMTEPDGTQVAASTQTVQVASDGSFSLTAYPTITATSSTGQQGALYATVRFYTASSGSITQRWYIPASGSPGFTFPLTIQQILKASPLNIPTLSSVPSTCTAGAEIFVAGAEYLCSATNVWSIIALDYQHLPGTPNALLQSQLGAANGVAGLDANAKLLSSEIPAVPYGDITGAPDLSVYLLQSKVGQAGGAASLDGSAHVPLLQLPNIPFTQVTGVPNYLPSSSVGQPNGAASLDGGGKIPVGQIPALSYNSLTDLPGLSPVATNGGDYNSLINKPTLGTASTHAAGDFLATSVLGIPNGAASLDANGKVPTSQIPQINIDQITGLGTAATHPATDFMFANILGQPNGAAQLDSSGKLSSGELPTLTASEISDFPTALPPNGTASGDLAGSYPNPTVKGINGTLLSSLGAGILKQNGSGVPAIASSSDIKNAFGYTPADVAKNLTDLTNPAAARTALGLGSAATQSSTAFLPDPGTNGIVLRTSAGTDGVAGASDIENVLGFTPANAAKVGAANGIATLDASSLVPLAEIPVIPFTQLTGVPAYVPLASVGVANGIATLDGSIKVPLAQIPEIPIADVTGLGTIATHGEGEYIFAAAKGAANGVASLDGNTLVPIAQIPNIPSTQITGLGTASTHPASDFVATTAVGAANGVASLDSTTKVPVAQVPALPYSIISNPPPISAVGHSGDYVDLLNAPTALPPNGPASGDLGGSFPAPTVSGLNGTKLSTLGAGLLKQNAQGIPAIAGTTDVTNAIGFVPMNPANNGAEFADKAATRAVLGIGTAGTHAATDFLADSGTNGLVKRTAAGTTAPATSADIITGLGFTPLGPSSIGVASGVAGLDSGGKVPIGEIPNIPFTQVTGVPSYILSSLIGATNGIAPLDSTGKVPSADLPAEPTATSSVPGLVTIGGGFIAQDAANGKLSVDGTLYDAAGTAAAVATASIPTSAKGTANGVATLDNSTHVPIAQIPTIPYANLSGAPSSFPPSGTAGGDLGSSYPTPTVVGLNGQNLAALGAGVLAQSSSGIPRLAVGSDVTTLLGFTPVNAANIGVANGVAGLDGTAKVPLTQIPVIPYTQLSGTPTIPTQYTLPAATADALGGVEVGSGLNVNSAGLLSANFGTAQGTIMQGNDGRVTGAVQSSTLGQPGGVATLNSSGLVPNGELGPAQSVTNAAVLAALGFTPLSSTTVGAAGGIASLDNSGKVPIGQIPTIPYANLSGTPTLGTIASHNTTDFIANNASAVETALGFTPISNGTIGQAGGIAALDSNGLLLTTELPAVPYTDLTGAPTGLPPIGAASGDLGSTYPAPKVVALNGTNLAGLGAGILQQNSAGVPSIVNSSSIVNALGFTPVNANTVGAANGLATLDSAGKVPLGQVPSLPYSIISNPPTIPAQYVLPVGTASVLGGFMYGTGLSATGSGVLSVNYGTTSGTAAQGNDTRIANAIQTSAEGAAGGVATLDGSTHIPVAQIPSSAIVTNANVLAALGYTPVNPNVIGVAGGIASLDGSTKVPIAQIPQIPSTDITGLPTFGDIVTHNASEFVAANQTAIISALGFTPVNNASVGAANGVATLGANSLIPIGEIPTSGIVTQANVLSAIGYTPINPTQIGVPNGIAGLDTNGHLLVSTMPSQIPASDIDQGEVSNTVFSYLADVSGPIQSQLNSTLKLGAGSGSGGTSGSSALANAVSALGGATSSATNVVFIGDSITRCYQGTGTAGDGANCPGTGPTNQSSLFWEALKTYIHSHYGNHGDGIIPIQAQIVGQVDPFYTISNPSGGGPYAGSISGFGPFQNGTSVGGSLYDLEQNGSISATGTGDTARIYWTEGSNSGAGFTVTVDGASSGTFGQGTTAGTSGVASVSLGSSGAHTVAVHVPNTANAQEFFHGFEFTSGSTGVSVTAEAFGYCRAECFGGNPSVNEQYIDQLSGGRALDVVMLGTNDMGGDASTYATNMNNLIAHEKARGVTDILIVTPPYNGISAGSGLSLSTIASDDASEGSGSGMDNYNSQTLFGSLAAMQSAGEINSDNVHLSDAGQQALGTALINYIFGTSGGGTSTGTSAGAVYYSGSGNTLGTIAMSSTALSDISNLRSDAQAQIDALNASVTAALTSVVHASGTTPILVTTPGTAPGMTIATNSSSGNAMLGLQGDTNHRMFLGVAGSAESSTTERLSPGSFFVYDPQTDFAPFSVNSTDGVIINGNNTVGNPTLYFDNDASNIFSVGVGNSSFNEFGISANSFFIYDKQNSFAPFTIDPTDGVHIKGQTGGAGTNATLYLSNDQNNSFGYGIANSNFNQFGITAGQAFLYDQQAGRAVYTVAPSTDNVVFSASVEAVGGLKAPTMTLEPQGSPPSCSNTNDGQLWNQAQSGQADAVVICQNNGSGSYSWVPFKRGGNNTTALSGFTAALSSAGSHPVHVAIVGDSLAGLYGLPNPDTGGWPLLVQNWLQSAHGNGGSGMLPLAQGTLSDNVEGSVWWTVTGGTPTYQYGGIGPYQDSSVNNGGPFSSLVDFHATNPVSFTTKESWFGNQVTVYAVLSNVTYPFPVLVDGTQVGMCGGTVSSAETTTCVYNVASGNHTVTIENAASTGDGIDYRAWVYGVKISNTASGVDVLNISHTGAEASAYTGSIGGTTYPVDNVQSTDGNVDLVIIELGANEYLDGTPLATLNANLTTLLNHFKAYSSNPSILIWDFNYFAGSAQGESTNGAGLTQEAYHADLKTFAAANNCAFLSMYDFWGKTTAVTDNDLYSADLAHPNSQGNSIEAQELENILSTGHY